MRWLWCFSSGVKDEAPRLRRPRRPARGSGHVAWLSGLVAVILILGQAFVVLHFDLIPHRFCPLHGIEDVHYIAGAKHRAIEMPAPGERHVTARGPSSIVVAHERCALAMLVHDRLAYLPARGFARVAAPGSTRLAYPTLDEALLPNRQKLDLAPKIGPPA